MGTIMLTVDFFENVVPRDRVRRGAVFESDAVVVGTGAGGAVVARELAAGGWKVRILEEGEYFTGRDYGSKTPLESIKMLYRKGGLTATLGNVPVMLPVGCCVGGSTAINSGTALHPLPSAVDRWRHEFGLADLTDHLDSYAERVEGFLGVNPVPQLNRANALFKLGTEKMGYEGSVLTRNAKNCQGAGRCYLGCPNDAKQAMNVSYIPDALRRGAVVYTRARARRVLVENGRAVGVATSRAVFRAPVVVVAAGAVHTPVVLRRPGRHLKIHPGVKAIGLFDEEVRLMEGVPQGYHVTGFLEQGISLESITLSPGIMGSQLPDPSILRHYNHLAVIACRIIESDSEGRIFRNPFSRWPVIWYSLAPSDVDKARRAVVIAAEIYFAAGARKVFTGIHGFEQLEYRDLDRLRNARLSARDLELMANHPQGSARMADSPDLGLADPDGQVWDTPGLYIADGSAMPASPIANPQLSIMMFATHVARKILERAGRSLWEENYVAGHHPH